MEYKEYTAKTVSEAITDACQDLGVTSDRLDYEVVEKESAGFLGIGSKPALIKARVKEEASATEADIENNVNLNKDNSNKDKSSKEASNKISSNQEVSVKEGSKEAKSSSKSSFSAEHYEESAKTFLKDVFAAMKLEVTIVTKFDDAEKNLDIDLSGDDMGMLIGKRGATLDSLQYLVSLVVNKDSEDYIRVKVDTENYRERRKETLENLAKNIAYKVKRTKRSVSLEPMNPYERRIIHSALQNDKFVTTHSEGEDPYRRVIISLKK